MSVSKLFDALCMQVTFVECESSFSTQNRLKSKLRSSLGNLESVCAAMVWTVQLLYVFQTMVNYIQKEEMAHGRVRVHVTLQS